VARARLAFAELAAKHPGLSITNDSPAGKELKAASDAVDKALQVREAQVRSSDTFTAVAGARWSPTRFLSSTADDPDVPFPPTTTGRRTALAEWITDPRNPLTARVAVNHIWMRHLGVPLVATVFDFGRKGTPPTNPRLLDWLAAEFVESGWDMKHLHRLIVTSSVYRLGSSAAGDALNAARDPDNRFLWRRVPLRLEAQAVRDALLWQAGTLDLSRGGPPVLPGEQESSRRRSLYFYHSNNDHNLFLSLFDDAGVKECYRRSQSIVPQQALALTNSRLVFDSSERIAARIAGQGAGEAALPDDAAFVRRAFVMLLGFSPSQPEVAASLDAMAGWRALGASGSREGARDMARASLVRALINHNDFVTIR
jgi:hypothetical protein